MNNAKDDSILYEDHFLVKAYSGTSTARISELFNICREASVVHDEMAEVDAIQALKDHVNAYITNLTRDIVETINRELADTFAADRFLAVRIIESLIDVPYMDFTVKRSRFANFLHTALAADSERHVDAVCKGLQMLVKDGGSLTPEIVSAEAARCFEWLSSGNDKAVVHYAACRVLTMFATEVPEMIKPHFISESFLDSIWNGLCSSSLSTRETALATIDQFLDSGIMTMDVVSRSLREVELTLSEQAEPSFWHGALLMLSSIIRHARNPSYYDQIIDVVVNKRHYVDYDCRITLLTVIPTLVKMSDLFLTCHLSQTLKEVLYVHALKGDGPTKSCAFIAMAELISTVGAAGMATHLNDIMEKVHAALKSGDDVTVEALKCLGEIAKVSDKTWLQPHVEVLMVALFAKGLNSYLTEALTIMGKSVPEFIPVFQEKLLTTITKTLKIQPSGPHHRRSGSDIPTAGDRMSGSIMSPLCIHVDERIIAMRTLATFNPKVNASIMMLVTTHLLPLLGDASVDLRIASVRTILQLLSAFAEPQEDATNTAINAETLGKIVDVGVADISELFALLCCRASTRA